MRLGRSQRRSGRFGEEINLLTLPGFELQAFKPVAYSPFSIHHPGFYIHNVFPKSKSNQVSYQTGERISGVLCWESCGRIRNPSVELGNVEGPHANFNSFLRYFPALGGVTEVEISADTYCESAYALHDRVTWNYHSDPFFSVAGRNVRENYSLNTRKANRLLFYCNCVNLITVINVVANPEVHVILVVRKQLESVPISSTGGGSRRSRHTFILKLLLFWRWRISLYSGLLYFGMSSANCSMEVCIVPILY
jgi:hypothetical protein